ncbi:MAG: tetratricopeptide repeat protein [Proteobacteria bacterium]|nr:tetratricopeptide repeat protein [Pseudomonadota bacterium]MDA1355251.1 tetratricopeptide repeat protein [Pseudomonadota bacterium]
MADSLDEMNQGSLALRNGDFTAAVVHLSTAINSNELLPETNAAMRISRAQALYHLEQYQPAADDLTTAIDSGAINDTLVGIALATRASAFRKLENWARALADFDAAIELGTVNQKMFFHRGLTLEASGQLARALEDFHRAHDMAPDNEAIRKKLLELGETVD